MVKAPTHFFGQKLSKHLRSSQKRSKKKNKFFTIILRHPVQLMLTLAATAERDTNTIQLPFLLMHGHRNSHASAF